MLFAEIEPVPSYVQLVVQTGGLGIAAWLIYLLSVTIPKVLTSIQAERDTATKEREARDNRFEKVISTITDSHERTSRKTRAEFRRGFQRVEAAVSTACKSAQHNHGENGITVLPNPKLPRTP